MVDAFKVKGNWATYCVNPGRFLGEETATTTGKTEAKCPAGNPAL